MRNKLWHTGVDDQGNQLPPAPKTQDPHWELVSGPMVTQPRPAYVLNDQRIGTYFQTGDSLWLGADPSGSADSSSPYIFQTKFYVEIDTKHWIQINGIWGVDNYGQFTIDNAPLPPGCGGGETSLLPGFVGTNYGQQHAFSISEVHPISLSRLQLKVGWHTLEVWVHNEGNPGQDNPSAFNVSADIVVHSVESWRDRQIAIHR
jgi:hypothetical protein